MDNNSGLRTAPEAANPDVANSVAANPSAATPDGASPTASTASPTPATGAAPPTADTPTPTPWRDTIGRIAFWLQWLYPLIIAFALSAGREIVFRQQLGWMALAAIMISLAIAPLWWLLCGLTLARRRNRRAKRLPFPAAICSLGGLAVIMASGMFLDDSGDMAPFPELRAYARHLFEIDEAAAAFYFALLLWLGITALYCSIVLSLLPDRLIRDAAGASPSSKPSSAPETRPNTAATTTTTGHDNAARIP